MGLSAQIALGAGWTRRDPEKTVLYGAVQGQWREFVAELAAGD